MAGAAGLGTNAEHLASYERQTGKKLALKVTDDLEAPEFPDLLQYVWDWFEELSKRRSYHAAGANPLTWLELEVWARMTGVEPTRRECLLLFRLDDVVTKHEPESPREP